MKKLLVCLIFVCILLPTAAFAGPPEDVAGDFTYIPSPECGVVKQANGNLVMRECEDVGDWYNGPLDGTSFEVYDLVFFGWEGDYVYERAYYKGKITFTGDFDGREGTLTIIMSGWSYGDLAEWFGHWTILNGTGELANLHGNGVMSSNGMGDVHYEGQMHFAGE